jgi:hypothetical protein
LLLVLAKLFVAMLAGNAGVCGFGKAFGMAFVIPFPTEQ